MTSKALFPDAMLVDGCLYTIDRILVFELRETYLNEVSQGAAAVKVDTLSGSFQNFRESQNLQTIYKLGNVSFDRVNSTSESISDAITNFFRENEFTSFSNPAEGTVLHDQTCLSVRWRWLALPTT